MANIQNLIKILADKATTANSVDDVAYLSKIIEKLDTGYFVTVTNFSDLPDPTNLKLGLLYYVVNDKLMYYVKPNSLGVKYWESLLNNISYDLAYSFGLNSVNGDLGDGTTVNKSSPVFLAGGFTDWVQISDSAGLRNNTIWTWGTNERGQLGDGTSGPGTEKFYPVAVIGGFTDWCQVSSGENHVVAVRQNGTIWAWGNNNNSELAINSKIPALSGSPRSIVGGFTDWCQVSAGQSHNVALRTNGTLWAWGSGNKGQLGNLGSYERCSPVSVVGGFTDWCQISAGYCNSSAIRTNGTLWTWGYNNCGQLGDGTTVSKSSPVSVIGGFTDWCQVSLGEHHGVAVRTNGTLWAWGLGQSGRLGDNCQVNKCSPVSVVGGFTDWCQVSSGRCHTVALRQNGTLWAWGCGESGLLGNNSTTNNSSPVSVLGGFTDWCQVAARDHTVAIRRRSV